MLEQFINLLKFLIIAFNPNENDIIYKLLHQDQQYLYW